MSSKEGKKQKIRIDNEDWINRKENSCEALSDENLEKIAGGFEFIDTCRNRFEEYTCWNAFRDRCDQLIILQEDNHLYEKVYHLKCKKGYFTNIIYKVSQHG